MVRAQTRAPQRANQRQQLQQHALAYANEAGWPVFPLRPGTKRPATPNHTAEDCNGTDPRCTQGHTGWEQRATTDPGRIARAWDQRPWGIGIACGPAGLVVVDLDVPKQSGTTGAEALRQLELDDGQDMPATFTVATPSGGRHLYYTNPPGETHGNTASKVAAHIDTRAAGGYVVAPPTQLSCGDSYHIIDDHLPAELPRWFSQLLSPPTRPTTATQTRHAADAGSDRVKRYVAAALNSELDRLATTSEGQRNHTLFTASIAVGQLVGAALLPATEAEEALEQAAASHVAAGAYSSGQARKTIASGLRRGQREPRRLPANLTTMLGQRTR